MGQPEGQAEQALADAQAEAERYRRTLRHFLERQAQKGVQFFPTLCPGDSFSLVDTLVHVPDVTPIPLLYVQHPLGLGYGVRKVSEASAPEIVGHLVWLFYERQAALGASLEALRRNLHTNAGSNDATSGGEQEPAPIVVAALELVNLLLNQNICSGDAVESMLTTVANAWTHTPPTILSASEEVRTV